MKKFDLIQNETGYQLLIDGMPYSNLIAIPKGSFLREDGRTVTVNGFCMAQFPVTRELYEAVTGNKPSSFQGKNHPVENVTWYDAFKFCMVLNNLISKPRTGSEIKTPDNLTNEELDRYKLNPLASGFRLPTEAEWEYAARGMGTELYAGSKHLDLVGWYNKNNNYETKTVGLKFPNSFGLYDMSGNVWEWCWDWYGEYSKKLLENPLGAESGSYRVSRGGSWGSFAICCRTGFRSYWHPYLSNYYLGFRLLFVP